MSEIMRRREFIALFGGAAVAWPGSIWRASAQTRTPEDLQLNFLRWSRIATGFADLTPEAARTCLNLLLRSGISIERLSEIEPDSYRGTSIEKQLLEAWYSGVFSLAELSEVRDFETTLMWRAAGLNPSPSICNTGPERWASAP